MRKVREEDLLKRIEKIESTQTKTAGENEMIRKVLNHLTLEEQANLARAIVAWEKQEQGPDFSLDRWFTGLPPEQQTVLRKVQQFLPGLKDYICRRFSTAPIDLQIAVEKERLEATPGAFDTGPDLETLSKSSRKARQPTKAR